MHINIKDYKIGNDNPTFLIAEVGQAHDGSLGMAYAFVDMTSEAGFDAIKFQTHIASAESTFDEPFRVKFSRQDNTRFDYWKRMEFTEDQWYGLAQYAEDKGLIFLSSPFSIEAVQLLERVNIPAWKVGSGEFKSLELIDSMLATGKPILLSTGMSSWTEIDFAVDYVRNAGGEIALFQCTSAYPTKLEEVGLNVISQMKERYDCVVGLSDHSGSIWPAISAMVKGVDIIEIHITMHPKAFGPDTIASLTMEDMALLVEARHNIDILNSNPVDKDNIAKQLSRTRSLFTKSVAPSRNLKANVEITPDMLMLKKPGSGIPASEMEKLYGKKLRHDVSKDQLLKTSDFYE